MYICFLVRKQPHGPKNQHENDRLENPLENDPLVTQLFDPLPFSFSSKKKMQADETKNRSSLRSI